MAPRVGIVMPVYNQWALSARCLDSLLKNSRTARSLVVVDNESTDETPRQLQEQKRLFESKGWEFQILTLPKNVGFGGAVNRGMRLSIAEWVAIVSNDTTHMEGWDSVLLHEAERLHLDVVMPHPIETPFDPLETPRLLKAFAHRNAGKVSSEFSAIVLFFKKATFDRLQGFDERFFLTCEDEDLRMRMQQAGIPFASVASSTIWHHSKGTRASSQHLQAHVVDYESESQRLFQEKWGINLGREQTRPWIRWRRRFRAWKRRRGLF